MKWMLTKTRGGDAVQRYVRWLGNLAIQSHLAGKIGEVPADLSVYSALLLTGGGDVNPHLYNQEPQPSTHGIQNERDALEISLIKAFFDVGKPVFGVCRGIQLINVALGGALIQHIPDYLRELNPECGLEEHRKIDKVDAAHGLIFAGDSRLSKALGNVHTVNSAHHQAVRPSAVGEGLRVVAVSGAGIIEAVEGEGLPSPVLAVQWHPERLEWEDPASSALLQLMREIARSRISNNHY